MVSKRKQRLNFLYMGIAVVLLIFMALLFSNQPFSIVSSSQIIQGDDEKPYWVIEIDGRNQGGEYVFTQTSNELDTYESSQGEVVPQEDINIVMKDIQPKCVYTLSGADESFSTYLARFIGISNGYFYSINPVERTSVDVTMLDKTSGQEQTIDALDWTGDNIAFNYNNGKIRIEPTGARVGNYECPQLSGYAVAINDETKAVGFAKRDTISGDLRPATQEVTTTLGMSCSVSNIPENPSSIKSELICNIGDEGDTNMPLSFVNPSLVMTADARYLDFKYIPTTVGVPEIVEIIQPESLNAGEVSSINVRVKNVGENSGNFRIKVESPSLTVLQSSRSEVLESGEEKEVSFSVSSPIRQKEGFTSSCEVTMCSDGEFGQVDVCDTSNECSIDIKKDKEIDFTREDTCGNGIQDPNENAQTCPQDFGTTIACNGLHMSYFNNKCVCADGYEMSEDDYGNQYCAEEESDNMIVVYGVLALVLVILVVMVVIARRRNK